MRVMSSSLHIVRICEFCKNEFIAKKTTSKTCSDACAKRLYKLNVRNDKIARSDLETEIKRRPASYITESDIRVIQAKNNLTLIEAAIILNITPLTLRRWTLAGRIKSYKAGRKHIFKSKDLKAILNG